jgi:hypothetical protein
VCGLLAAPGIDPMWKLSCQCFDGSVLFCAEVLFISLEGPAGQSMSVPPEISAVPTVEGFSALNLFQGRGRGVCVPYGGIFFDQLVGPGKSMRGQCSFRRARYPKECPCPHLRSSAGPTESFGRSESPLPQMMADVARDAIAEAGFGTGRHRRHPRRRLQQTDSPRQGFEAALPGTVFPELAPHTGSPGTRTPAPPVPPRSSQPMTPSQPAATRPPWSSAPNA